MIKQITTPLTDEQVKDLQAGDQVAISGVVYTSRDAGHARMVASLEKGEPLPFDIKDAVIYYVGPAPTKPGQVINSAGPTTSYRMDPFAPKLLDIGLKGMIGKGDRSDEVVEAIQANNGVYFAAVGGAAALIASSIQSAEVIAYDDLGTEALRRLEVKDFPCIVVIDSKGNNLYASEKAKYRTFSD